jgi:macrolide transport system ATP-binding/permease protein
MSQVALKSVSKAYGRRVLFDGVSFTIRPGEHVGIVGDNGAGKSTLLRLMIGLERPDAGDITLQAAGGIGHLEQTLELPPSATVQQAIDAALADLRRLETELRSLERRMTAGHTDALTRYGEILNAFEARGGYAMDDAVTAALDGLGLARIGRDRLLGTLSGGEGRRLALACLLAAAPEIMLLDEPTNHLDDASLAWLEERLRSHRGTVGLVSHDRLFLERVATAILELDADQQTIVRHGNGYAGYLHEKVAARRRWEADYAAWQAEVDEVIQRSMTTARGVGYGRRTDNDKMGFNFHASRVDRQVASRVRNAEERLRRLQADPVARPPDPLAFDSRFSGGNTSGVLVALDQVSVSGRLEVPELTIRAGQRLLIRGPNGAGKTTLLRVMVGDLAPEIGSVRRAGRLAYLPQEVPATHSPRPLLHAFAEGLPGPPDEHVEHLLSLGLFHEDDLWVPVARLSVGQRQRLALARMLLHECDLLLLDEPTNHLAPDLVEQLEAALLSFEGALIVVSHDRLLRSRLGLPERLMDSGRFVPSI